MVLPTRESIPDRLTLYLNDTMKTATKKTSQPRKVEAYLRKNRKQGITTMEAFQHLGITCLHKRVAELGKELFDDWWDDPTKPRWIITRTPERTASGTTITRYKLAKA